MLRRALAGLVCGSFLVSGSVWANQATGESLERAPEQLEEVVIRADRPEEAQLEEQRRMEKLRQQLLEDFSRNQLLEKRDNLREQQKQLESNSSIKLGFDEKRDRQNFHLAGGSPLPWSDISPASFISVSF